MVEPQTPAAEKADPAVPPSDQPRLALVARAVVVAVERDPSARGQLSGSAPMRRHLEAALDLTRDQNQIAEHDVHGLQSVRAVGEVGARRGDHGVESGPLDLWRDEAPMRAEVGRRGHPLEVMKTPASLSYGITN